MAYSIRYPFVKSLVGSNGKVLFDTLEKTHQFLLATGFKLVDRDPRNRGYHLFYVKDDILVRIKTHGDPSGPRKDQAHLSIANWSESLKQKGEWGKANRSGLVIGSPLYNERKKKPRFKSHQRNSFALWAAATHFDFPLKKLEGGGDLKLTIGHA